MRFVYTLRALRSSAAALLICVLCLVPVASARPMLGSGDIADGKLNLLVYFTYAESDPSAWEPVFEEYSKLLLNATEGVLQLGQVQFTSCAALSDEADVWVLNDNSGARAHIGGLGRSGQHITISQTHRSTTGFARGQFGLAHETGHYVWSLYDEYLGFIDGVPGTSPKHFCSTATGAIGCLMDGGTTVFPNFLRTEFCTDVSAAFPDTIHNDGLIDVNGDFVVTNQEYVYSTSCWRQMQRDGSAGLTHPSTEPTDVDFTHENVVFDLDRYYGTLAMGLLVDTSGSMSASGRLDGAILGSELALGMLRDGETQAVYGFDDTLTTVVAPQTVTSSRRDAAILKVGTLVAYGGTQAGEALLDVAQDIGDSDACRRFLILLTDGISSSPDVNEAEVLQALLLNDVQVYTVALGSFTNDSALMELASTTGGQFFSAPTPAEVPGVFAQIFALAGGGSLSGSFQGPGASVGQTIEFSVDVPVDSDALTVALAAAVESDPVLELLGPSGSAVSSDSPPTGVEFVQAGDVLLLRVPNPQVGTWRIGFATRSAVAAEVTVHAAIESRLLSVTTAVAADLVEMGEPAHLEVSVVFGVPVAGAVVRGTVLGPDGYREPLALFDDGHPSNGDLQSGDGIYSALLSEFAGPGIHRVDYDVVNINGIAASNRECGVFGLGSRSAADSMAGPREDGAEFLPVAPFSMRTSRTFLVIDSGGPPQAGTAELRPHSTGPTGGEGGALAFTLAVGPEQALRLERLELEFPAGAEDFDGYELYLDQDLDGRLDRPRKPLARARANGQALVMERAEGDLALLPRGAVTGFLLVAPISPRAAQLSAAAGGLLAPDSSRNLGGLPLVRVLSTGTILLGFMLLFRARAKYTSKRPWTLASGASAAALLLMIAPACHSRGGAELLSAELDPADLVLFSASTGHAVSVAGDPLRIVLSR
ncbi:MAG: calcium-activated chloride channel regulator 4 [Planctomycetota bacterium]|jgi:calcium-activated chloride channel regulator 4